jgi:hypothetical protein
MAVNCVVAQVDLASRKPLHKWRLAVVAYLVEGSKPVDKFRLFAPKVIGFIHGLPVNRFKMLRHVCIPFVVYKLVNALDSSYLYSRL